MSDRKFRNPQTERERKRRRETQEVEVQKMQPAISRRTFFAIAGTTTAIAGTLLATRPWETQLKRNNENDEFSDLEPRTAAVLKATRLLEECGNAIEWHHPEGHQEGTLPNNPVIYIPDIHSDPSGGVTNIDVMYRNYMRLMQCSDAGIKNFGCEGRTIGTKFEHMLGVHDARTKSTLTPQEFGTALRDPEYFRRVVPTLLKQGRIMSDIFAFCSKESSDVRGVEPNDTIGRTRAAEVMTIMEIMEMGEESIFAFKEGTLANLKTGTTWNPKFVHSLLERYLAIADEAAQFSTKGREEFVGDNTFDRDVILFGCKHEKNLIKKWNESSRSVAVVRDAEIAKYLREHPQEFNEGLTQDMRSILEYLQKNSVSGHVIQNLPPKKEDAELVKAITIYTLYLQKFLSVHKSGEYDVKNGQYTTRNSKFNPAVLSKLCELVMRPLLQEARDSEVLTEENIITMLQELDELEELLTADMQKSEFSR